VFTYTSRAPELLPILSRGKHRNPRKGACFMELASHLAGERWSDHPACTHPLLAEAARQINDHTTDAGRQRLAVMVPSVIGLTTDDPHVDALIALRCARTALPVVSADRQRVMAVSVRACERMLADLDGLPPETLSESSREALEYVPQAARWAKEFTRPVHTSTRAFRRYAAPSTVGYAVSGIARACIPDPDTMLYDLLLGVISDCAARVDRPAGEGRPGLRPDVSRS
jgi:hypothetical protein